MIIELKVPYAEKDEAKRLGARWNPTKKVWYVHDRMDLFDFYRWIPHKEMVKATRIDKSEPLPVVSTFEDDGHLKIWCDGACEPNPGIGGWGWHRNDGQQQFGGEEETTNNRMEMTAILEALSKLPDGQVVTVYTDSQYCLKGLTVWRNGWKKKNWMKKKGPIPNRDIWVLLEAQLIRLDASFVWVKGHSGDPGNEKADLLAERGRSLVAMPTMVDLQPEINSQMT